MSSQPSEFDIRNYVLHHPLSRPYIPWTRIISIVALCEGLLLCGIFLLDLKAWQMSLLADAYHSAILIVCGKPLFSTVIKIYQRYAPEHVRRQCKCKSTCSEYALLALEKYPWPKALFLIVKRVTHTCEQPGYKIDYP